MTSFKIKHHGIGSNIVHNPLEIKKISVERSSAFGINEPSPGVEQNSGEEIHSERITDSDSEKHASTIELSDAERRNKRKEEYREAALIREKAVQMQKRAQEQIKQTEQFYSLMQQAKDDPVVLAKALNITPEEFQRKLFNKMYSIKDEPQKEETFEEQTKRKLTEYEQERELDKERRVEEQKKYSENEFQRVKHSYITNNIIPLINESHEFIHKNDKYSCAGLIYDLMNQAYQDATSKNEDFTLKAEDVVNQLEEELEKRAEQQILEARNIGKLKKYFQDEPISSNINIGRKEFRRSSSSSTTLSNNLGSSVPPSATSPNFGSSFKSSERKISFSDRHARREATKRNLSQG